MYCLYRALIGIIIGGLVGLMIVGLVVIHIGKFQYNVYQLT